VADIDSAGGSVKEGKRALERGTLLAGNDMVAPLYMSNSGSSKQVLALSSHTVVSDHQAGRGVPERLNTGFHRATK
jgi:hypothetical protein